MRMLPCTVEGRRSRLVGGLAPLSIDRHMKRGRRRNDPGREKSYDRSRRHNRSRFDRTGHRAEDHLESKREFQLQIPVLLEMRHRQLTSIGGLIAASECRTIDDRASDTPRGPARGRSGGALGYGPRGYNLAVAD
jgi:hypothetical protein